MAHLPQRAEDESGGRAAAERRQEQFLEATVLDEAEVLDAGDAAEGAAEDAGVNQRGTLQQQKQREHEKAPADAIAFAHLGQPCHDHSEEQAAQSQQVDARQGVPGVIRRRGLLQGRVQHKAEVDAFKEIFGLQEAHGGAVSLKVLVRWDCCENNELAGGWEEAQNNFG